MSDKDSDQFTATRYTLTEEWKDARTRVDWIKAPGVEPHVNSLVSGQDGVHWAQYALKKHVQPLREKRGTPLSMASLGCGSGYVESSLIKQFGWPISRVLGLEYDEQLRVAAAADFKGNLPDVSADFQFFDFNNPRRLDEKFDILFTCHAIHHATDLEAFLPAINQYLKDDGLFIGIDFFGPTRFQIEHDVLPIIKELFAILPRHLRRDLRFEHEVVMESFDADTIEMVRTADRSESVRSSDLRTLLFSSFPIVEIKEMGGTLLRWLMQNRAGNFYPHNPDHVAIVKLLIMIEREMIALRRIRSDDLFFVLTKSKRL